MVGRAAARGWVRIGPDDRIAGWAAAALPLAQQALATSHEDWRCGGTWFVGVDALTNDPDGAVAGVPLPWQALGLPAEPLHRAQLSVIRPGYPQPSPDESAQAFAFRRDRDAAHVDGLIAEGEAKRRRIREPHGFILGIALNAASADASPLVVWDGSHRIVGPALRKAVEGRPSGEWGAPSTSPTPIRQPDARSLPPAHVVPCHCGRARGCFCTRGIAFEK